MSISFGIDTKFEYIARLDPKLQTNTYLVAAILNFTLQWLYAMDTKPSGL